MSATADDCNQKVVCILGMHRSGTSVVARTLNLIGVDLGSEDAVRVEPAYDNSKGHWEHKEIAFINETILRRYGGSWDEPPILPEGWETSSSLDDLRNDVRKLMRDQFANASLWGWKDPRTSLTLPFWQLLLSNIHYIICLRNPLDVASSLEQRNELPAEKSFYLWLAYVSSALKYTEGKPRLVVFYEDLIEKSAQELDRLAAFVGQSERARKMEAQADVKAFIEKRLQHHSSPLLDTSFNSTEERDAKTLYVAQRISADAVLKTGTSNLVSFLTSNHINHEGNEGEVESLLQQLVEREEMVHRLSAQLEEQSRVLAVRVQETVCELRDQLRQKDLELERLKDTVAFRFLGRWHRIKHIHRVRQTKTSSSG